MIVSRDTEFDYLYSIYEIFDLWSIFAKRKMKFCLGEARGPAFGGINSAPSEAGNANFTTWLPGLVSYVFDFGLPSYIFFMRKLPKVACYSVALAKDSCVPRSRTRSY